MDKIEEKVLKKYKKEISRIIKNKYRKKAKDMANKDKFYLSANKDMRKSITQLANDIYATFLPVIDEEIENKVNNFINSEKFKNSVKAENSINKKKLSCKSLKKFQEFEIGINNKLLDNLLKEVNSDISETPMSKEELKYILLSILYKIIDCIKNGYKVKIGTMLSLWLNQRDVRVNLPQVKNRILEDRLVPKLTLGKSFGYNLFQTINKDNLAIMNYYQAKMERFLMLIKKKKS